jgi:LacI family transcriptional regulator
MPSRPPTSHDVARLAGVSQPTVSRALRDDPSVSEQTRRLVHQAADELGYILSARGRSLSTRTTGQIGIVVSDLANPFYLQVLDAAHAALARAGRRMLVLTPDGDDGALQARLLDGSLDGAILTTTLLASSAPAALARRGFPFALLNRTVDDAPGDTCTVDNVAGARLAAEALVRLGHTEIAALFGPQETSTGRDREAGFRAVLADAGVALPDHRVRSGPFDFAYGHAGLAALLPTRPTAVFCANDVIALGAFNAVRAAGLGMPEDLTLIGFDDIALAAWEVFGLTTVRQDIDRMVQTATDLVLARIVMPGRPREHAVLDPVLVERATHGPPPSQAKAIGSASVP